MRKAGAIKLWVVSDLHLEVLPHPEHYALDRPADFDALVVAGDVQDGRAQATHDLVARLARGKPAFIVMGNHDPRGGSIQAWTRSMRAACSKGAGLVRLLDRDVATLDCADGRIAIAGATLWTDYTLHAGPGALDIAAGEDIRSDGGRKAPRLERREIADLHRRDRAWLGTLKAADFEDPLVVVTHHAPHPACCSGVSLACLEATDMRTEIAAIGATTWIHGHVHSSRDFPASTTPGSTRIVSNPAGPHFCNPDFIEDLVVEIEP